MKLLRLAAALCFGLTLAGSAAALTPALPPPPPVYSAEDIAGLKARATAGDVQARVALGDAYYRGYGVSIDFVEAREWYILADNREAVKAIDSFVADHTRLLAAAQTGDAKAQYDFAEHLPHMVAGVEGDKPETWWLRLSGDQGYASAQNTLGFRYFQAYGDRGLHPENTQARFEGEAADTDMADAIAWTEKAAEQNDVGAQYALAQFYAVAGPQQDIDKVHVWLERSVATDSRLGGSWALCRLDFTGGLHFYPMGMETAQTRIDFDGEPDYDKAFKSCSAYLPYDLGNWADYPLGYMYRYGKGVPKDDAQAVAHLTVAMNWGGQETRLARFARYELALIYIEGKAVPRDCVKARQLLRLATYTFSFGPPTEYFERQAYDRAAAHFDDWKQTLKDLEAKMTPDEIRKSDS